jgi:hypothetical protein
MKTLWLLPVFCAVGIVPAQITEPASSSSGAASLSIAENTNILMSSEIVLELKIKSALLLSLSEEHLKRSEQDQVLNQPEKSRWERELAAELQVKNASIAKQLADLRAQHSRGLEPNVSTALNRALPANGVKMEGLDADEIAYLGKLGEKLAECEQGIAAALETGQSYVMQFQTNNTPDQMQRVSALLEDNRHVLHELNVAQSDLELRKLEFWAYRRRKM